ncbi:hypothetical protein [Bacillus sp. NPDC077027]|uniref:hypothetical protein n=1 Tax=Bacillus sp. NPDC077027 TaxID=3390548 RepID=UPI003D073AAA
MLYKRDMKKTKEDLLTFVTKNKKDVSVTIIENDDVVFNWNGDQKTPLAWFYFILLKLCPTAKSS